MRRAAHGPAMQWTGQAGKLLVVAKAGAATASATDRHYVIPLRALSLMTFYRLTFYPNGHLDGERLDTDEVDAELVASFRPLFDAGLVFETTIPVGGGNARVKWTGSDGGQALFTFSYDGKPFLSGAFVAGKEPAGDADVLQMFAQSLEATPLLQQLAGRANRLAALLDRPDRPLLAGVVWPTLPAELFEQIQGLDTLLSVEFLRRTGGAG